MTSDTSSDLTSHSYLPPHPTVYDHNQFVFSTPQRNGIQCFHPVCNFTAYLDLLAFKKVVFSLSVLSLNCSPI